MARWAAAPLGIILVSLVTVNGLSAAAAMRPVEAKLRNAQDLYDNLDYEEALPIIELILEVGDAPLETKRQAYRLQGSILAIIGDSLAAETPFRLLLRLDADFDLPDDTPPKILAAFRKVQVEEQRLRAQMQAFELQQLIASLRLEASLPDEIAGGSPLKLEYRLRDPKLAVSEVRVQYRKNAEDAFSSIALKHQPGSRWIGEIPGEWTANEGGQTFDYFVTTHDSTGQTLLTVASAAAPRSLSMLAGSVADAQPFYRSPWFWVISAVAVVGAGIATGVAIIRSRNLPPTDLGESRIP